MKKILIASLIGVSAFAAVTAYAETRYVTDIVYINIRTTEGENGRSLRTIRSGTPLEVIANSDNDANYVKIRTEDGLEGWVNARYLSRDAIAETKVKRAEDAMRILQKENQQLKERLQTTSEDLKVLQKDQQQLKSENGKLNTQIDRIQQVSAKPIETEKENAELRMKNAELQKEVTELRSENDGYKDNSSRDWFLTGAGVVIIGLFIGLIVPRLRFRRQSSWA